jgi:hypothetical protein
MLKVLSALLAVIALGQATPPAQTPSALASDPKG